MAIADAGFVLSGPF